MQRKRIAFFIYNKKMKNIIISYTVFRDEQSRHNTRFLEMKIRFLYFASGADDLSQSRSR